MKLKRLKNMTAWELTKRGAYCQSMGKTREFGYIMYHLRKRISRETS